MKEVSKYFCRFALSTPKTLRKFENAMAIFMAIRDGWYLQRYKRLSNHNGLLHSCCSLSLARRGAIAFLILFSLIFHFMPKTNENYSMMVKPSTHLSATEARNASIVNTVINFLDDFEAPDLGKELTHMLCEYIQSDVFESFSPADKSDVIFQVNSLIAFLEKLHTTNAAFNPQIILSNLHNS